MRICLLPPPPPPPPNKEPPLLNILATCLVYHLTPDDKLYQELNFVNSTTSIVVTVVQLFIEYWMVRW